MKVNNIVAMRPWGNGEQITVTNEDPLNPTLQELTIVSVGPCVVTLHPKAEKGQDELVFILGVAEGRETFQWAFPGESYAIGIDPSGPVYYASPAGLVAVDVGEVPTFVRMEKPGLYLDELSFALHQQAMINRIAVGRERLEKDNYQAQLERRLQQLTEQIAALSPPPDQVQADELEQAEDKK